MTPPLPTPPKPSPAEGARPDMGNFFQLLSHRGAKDSPKPDFESFLENRNSRQPAEDLREEQEAAKSRKKSLEAAAISAPLQEIPATPKLDRPDTAQPSTPQHATTEGIENHSSDQPNSETPVKSPAETSPEAAQENPEASAEPRSDTENSTVEISRDENVSSSDQDPSSEIHTSESTADISEETLPKPAKDPDNDTKADPPASDANGMETAPSDSEMISLATLDGMESGALTAASREPSITSIHRLTAFAATDRNGLAPLGGAGNSAESGLGHLATGQGSSTELRSTPTISPAAQASALFKSLGPELEKFRQTGRNQMQLDIPVGDNESVRIRLSLRAGELRSTFITDSPELREALQKAWPEFAQGARDRGYRLGDPGFQQSFQGNDSSFGQNTRRDQSSSETPQASFPGSTTSRKPTSARPPANQPPTALWA